MADKIAEIIPTDAGSSLVLKSNSFSTSLMDKTGLEVTFSDPNGTTELTRLTVKPEEIEYDQNGYLVPLPPEINNELARKINSYGGKFSVKAVEYDPVSSKTAGDPSYFDASVTGTLKIIQDYVKKEGESISETDFVRKTDLSSETGVETSDKAENEDAVKTSDTVLNETAASVPSESSSKGKILAIIAAIVLLLFVLGLLALFLTGFLGGAKDNGSSNETAPQAQTEEAEDNTAKKDDNKASESVPDDADSSENNPPAAESQDNTPENEPVSQSTPAENTTAVNSLYS